MAYMASPRCHQQNALDPVPERRGTLVASSTPKESTMFGAKNPLYPFLMSKTSPNQHVASQGTPTKSRNTMRSRKIVKPLFGRGGSFEIGFGRCKWFHEIAARFSSLFFFPR